MKDLDAVSESPGQSAWDLFPSEQPDGGVPLEESFATAAAAPQARGTVAVPPRALPERESLRQWIVATACDLLMLVAIALARISNSTSAMRLPRVRVMTGEGLAVMTGAMLAAVVFFLTGSPARVASPPEMLEAMSPVSAGEPMAREISKADEAASPTRRDPATPGVTTRNATARVSDRSATVPITPTAKSPGVPDGTSGVPRSSPPAIASTIATAAAPSIDPPAAPPSPVPSRAEETSVAPSTTPPPSASPAPAVGFAVAAVPAVPPARPRSAAVQTVLNRYRDAFSALDPAAAKAVWPSADTKGLGKAFDRLHEQQMVLDTCNISVIGARAVASCEGTLRYVPNVGSRSPRVQRGRWDFTLREVGDGWTIETVKAR